MIIYVFKKYMYLVSYLFSCLLICYNCMVSISHVDRRRELLAILFEGISFSSLQLGSANSALVIACCLLKFAIACNPISCLPMLNWPLSFVIPVWCCEVHVCPMFTSGRLHLLVFGGPGAADDCRFAKFETWSVSEAKMSWRSMQKWTENRRSMEKVWSILDFLPTWKYAAL